MRRLSIFACVFSMLAGVVFESGAQWATQTIQLRPGWNSIYLEVEPEPRECDLVFAGLPVESVWRSNRRFNSVQFIQDTNQIILDPEDWLTWISAAHPLGGNSSLYILEGGLPYLIKTTNSSTVQWTVRGRPIQRKIDWRADSFNFVGFPLPITGANTFQNFFAGAAGLSGSAIYRISTAGIWTQVINPATTTMTSGEAFWIRASGLPTFQGPVSTVLQRRGGIEFGRTLTEQTFRIQNNSTNSRSVTVRQIASETPPVGVLPPVAGGVPLSYWQNNFGTTQVGWTSFPTQLQSNIPPGGSWEIRFEVRRRDMTPYSPPPEVDRALYQSLLEISEGTGLTRQLVPVLADGLNRFANEGGGISAANAGTPPHRFAGLWVGSATITNVSQPAAVNPTNPIPTASEFSFRLLVHVDAAGQARLLQKVLQMFKPGTYRPANDGTTNRVIDEPGRFVLLTDDRLIPQFAGVAFRDASLVGRRFSSAAFGFRQPIVMTGPADFGTAGQRWSCPVLLDYRDPLNPFVHRYHPDHDNLNERFEQVEPEGRESFTINRGVDLLFTAVDPENAGQSGWGDRQLGGLYKETISGLHRTSIVVSGIFKLRHASGVSVLNDGL